MKKKKSSVLEAASAVAEAVRSTASELVSGLARITSNGDGSAQIELPVKARTPVSFTLTDKTGAMLSVIPVVASRIDIGSTNLAACSDRVERWSVSPKVRRVEHGPRHSDDWSLKGTDTFFLKSLGDAGITGGAAEARLADPIGGDAIPAKPQTRYRLSILAGTHRCSATVGIEIMAGERVSGVEQRSVDRKFRGGREERNYHRITLDFMTPADTTGMRVLVHKGASEAGEKTDSYLFVARPEIMEQPDVAPGKGRILSAQHLGPARAATGMELLTATIDAPASMTRGETTNFDVLIDEGGRQTRIENMELRQGSPFKVKTFTLQHNKMHFRGRMEKDAPSGLAIALFVDGVHAGEAQITGSDDGQEGIIAIPAKFLDGDVHALELRVGPNFLRAAGIYELLPFQMTPWSALQSYARGPLNVQASPASVYHYRSLLEWGRKLENEPGAPQPPLFSLHQELLGGFRKRNVYPPLQFPRHDKPVISIVIPAHNKFEVTYFCLCSLLFAYNDTPFEVIVVDDGSKDTTTKIEEIVSGIQVVRHETAAGFVGACNDGAEKARGAYILFLNNDTEVTSHCLDELLEAFAGYDNIGVAGSKLLYPNGTLQEAGGMIWRSGNPWNVGRDGGAQDPQYNYLRQVDYVSGASLMIEKSLWKKVGGFSTEFAPGYFEDTDLCLKVRAAGYRVIYVPTSVVFHFEGQSSGTDVTSGMKRFQEVNRPKFKRKWVQTYSSHGADGVKPEREKDRDAFMRILFLDHRFPFVDSDAGGYAAFQEIRLLQSLGAKITFLPRNLAWMDRHTLALERIGVECIYAPFALNFKDYIRQHAAEYDMIYVNRFQIAQETIPLVREAAPSARIVLNLADLHFLRELRSAAENAPGYTLERAKQTRTDELAAVTSADLTLSYTDVEIAVLYSHLADTAKVAKLPWVVDIASGGPGFAQRKDIYFLGGFGHIPNIGAVEFFAREVMPILSTRLPGVVFNIVGSNAPPEILALQSENINIVGHVANLDDVFDNARVFVAPLQSGAGLKGKVLEAMSRGTPSVLSPVAAEGTSLTHGISCLIAKSAEQWANEVCKLYQDQELWERVAGAARQVAQAQFSFEAGVETMYEALAQIDVFGQRGTGLVYRRTRPQRYGV